MDATHPLRSYRRARGLTLDRLAEITGTTAATISRIETGRASPSMALLRRIAEATGGQVTPNDFIARSPAPQTAGEAA